jgi:hypothetical protein
MQKRGELTSTQIITLVIAIIGFVVVLIVVLSLNLKGQSEEEVCRISILERATLPVAGQASVPLKCTTKKICLSINGEECSQLIGESNVQNIRVSNKATEAARQIEQTTAQAMYDCWSMSGKGRYSLFQGSDSNMFTNLVAGQFSVNEAKAKCIFCSRIALSSQLQSKTDIIKDVNVNRYLKETPVPGSSLTYLQFFTDRQINSYPGNFSAEFSSSSEKNTTQVAIVFSQMITSDTAPIDEAVRAGTNTGIAIGGALLTPAGRVLKVIGAKETVALSVVAMLATGTVAYFQTSQNQALTATYCGKFASQNGLTGCSVVSPMDYNDVATINELCKAGIEGTITTPGGNS